LSFSEKDLNSFFRYALSLTHNDELAYDLVSHGVEKVLSRPFVLNKKAYAKTCIRNKFFDEYKRSKKIVEYSEEEEGLEYLEESHINKDLVAKLLDELDSQERELLYLWAVEDYTILEISKLKKMPKGTVNSQIFRIKKRLRSLKGELSSE
jgi:RNA polymerase sigma factor (sigma-70 family)